MYGHLPSYLILSDSIWLDETERLLSILSAECPYISAIKPQATHYLTVVKAERGAIHLFLVYQTHIFDCIHSLSWDQCVFSCIC